MSRYELDKALWQVIREPSHTEKFRADRQAFLSGRELSPDERSALEEADVRKLYELGALPFLVYQLAVTLEGFSMEMMVSYSERLKGLGPVDVTT